MALRKRARDDALEDAKTANMTESETQWFLAEADSNAIWDGEAGLPYRRFPIKYKSELIAGPMYKEFTMEGGQ